MFCLEADNKGSQESLMKPVLFHSLQGNVLSTGLQVMPKLDEPLFRETYTDGGVGQQESHAMQ